MVKYTLSYRAYDDTAWQVDISLDSYSGDPIPVRGVGDNACTFSYIIDETDDPYEPFIKSSAVISIYNQRQINVDELQNAQDKDFTVQVYRNSVIWWQGFLIPDGIQKPMKAVADITINATDGLSLLEKLPYSHNNLSGTTSDPTRCPMNYIRQILFSDNNLGNRLPIHWTCSIECTAFMDDFYTGQTTWSARGEGFADYQGTIPGDVSSSYVYKTCEYILRGILKSAQCRISQTDGKWVIRRINDIVTGTFDDSSILADLDIMVVTTEEIDTNKEIGVDYPFIREDQVTTVKPGIKSCKVTYEANSRENILPNGSQDFVSSLFNAPFYWATPVLDDATYVSVPGIDGRGGYATDITNPGDGFGTESYYTTLSEFGSLAVNNSLPIDSYTLVQRVSFGFIFSPINGFPYDTVTGIIDFSSDPMQVQIVYEKDSDTYYLDEFAIWRTTSTWISIKIDGLKINDIVQVDFNRNNAIILPKPTASPEPGDLCDISVRFKIKDGQRYTLDYIYLTTDENTDVYEAVNNDTLNTAIDDRTLEISSSWGGYFVSNYMTYWGASDEQCFFQDGSFYTGTLTGLTAQAIMRFLYKSCIIYNGSMNVRGKNWSFDEIYTIDDKKFLPLNATFNTETCEVSLVAIECRNDDISLSEKHYGSNDKVLSN